MHLWGIHYENNVTLSGVCVLEPLHLSHQTVDLQELLRRFDAGEYQLPAFQRPYVWKARQTLNLLDSLVRGYPISVIYLWEPDASSRLQSKNRTFKTKSNVHVPDKFRGYIIDGQQRLTSLHAAFGYAEAFDATNGRALECWLELLNTDRRDGKITTLFQSPAQKKFLADADAQQKPWRVRLADLLKIPHQTMREERGRQLLLHNFSAAEIDMAYKRIDAAYRMLNSPISCITITRSDDDEVLSVFKRLNRGGTGLKERDVRAADLGIGKSVEVLRLVQSFVSEELPTALGFGFSFAFRALVVFHKGTAQFNQLASTWADSEGDRGQTLIDSWREAENGLRAAMEVVERMGWSRKPLLPSCNALITLAYALHQLNRSANESERKTVARWYCLAALRGVFKGGVETTINKHLRSIKAAANPVNGLFSALTLNQARPIKADELMREPTTLWGPSSQVMFAWLVECDAKDWLTGQSLDKIARLGAISKQPEETLTIQHIFPRQLLAEQGYEQDKANFPANFAIIARGPNSSLNDLPPSEAIKRLESHDQRENARIQFFSKDGAGDLLQSDRYEEFLEWRAKRLAEAWNKWLGLPVNRQR